MPEAKKQTFIRKYFKPLVFTTFVMLAGFSLSSAYFTHGNQSEVQEFISGELKTTVEHIPSSLQFDWSPGSEHVVEYKISNTGSYDQNLKFYFAGDWSNPELDPNMVNLLKIERKENGNWVQKASMLYLFEEIHHSASLADSDNWILAPNETAEYRITYQFNPDVENEYQNQGIAINMHLAAKQVVEGASWPMTY